MSGENQYTQKKPWDAYPIATRVYSITGGYWEKTNLGYKWCTGSTFPTPGGDWDYIVEQAIGSCFYCGESIYHGDEICYKSFGQAHIECAEREDPEGLD